MKIISFLLLICLVVMLTGCPKKLYSTRPSTKLEQNNIVKQVNDFLTDRQQAYYCAINNGQVYYNYAVNKYSCGNPLPPSPTPTPTPSPILLGTPSNDNQALARRIRNEVIEKGVTAVDGVYNGFIDDLNTGRATTNFIADVVDLGLGATVGIAKGERPLQILGVALTAFRGGRKSIDINFFREQTVPILINKMDDNRAKIYSEIIQKRDNNKNNPVTDYPMEEVIKDIVRYFNAGTLIRAFAELSKDTAATARNNEENILRLKDVKVLDKISTQEEVNLTREIFKQLQSLSLDLNIDTNTTDNDLRKKREAAEKRIGLIYDLVNQGDTFKTTVEKLKTEDALKPVFERIKNNQATAKDKYDVVAGIFRLTEDDQALSKKLRDFFAITKTQ